jgi:hypothetical protein
VTALQSDVARLKEAIQSMSQQPSSPQKGRVFPPSVKKGKSFQEPDGIIAFLTQQCGGNVHALGVVSVTGSATLDGGSDYAPENVANIGTGQAFISRSSLGKEGNWVCYDFKNRRVIPTHYTVRSHDDPAGREHLKSWVVQASVDGKSWQEIDSKTNNSKLNGFRNTCTFPVSPAGPCRYIRLVLTGKDHRDDFILQIEAWEIFGTLIE